MHLRRSVDQEPDDEFECLVVRHEIAEDLGDHHVTIADHVVQLVEKRMTFDELYPGDSQYLWIALRIHRVLIS